MSALPPCAILMRDMSATPQRTIDSRQRTLCGLVGIGFAIGAAGMGRGQASIAPREECG